MGSNQDSRWRDVCPPNFKRFITEALSEHRCCETRSTPVQSVPSTIILFRRTFWRPALSLARSVLISSRRPILMSYRFTSGILKTLPNHTLLLLAPALQSLTKSHQSHGTSRFNPFSLVQAVPDTLLCGIYVANEKSSLWPMEVVQGHWQGRTQEADQVVGEG